MSETNELPIDTSNYRKTFEALLQRCETMTETQKIEAEIYGLWYKLSPDSRVKLLKDLKPLVNGPTENGSTEEVA